MMLSIKLTVRFCGFLLFFLYGIRGICLCLALATGFDSVGLVVMVTILGVLCRRITTLGTTGRCLCQA